MTTNPAEKEPEHRPDQPANLSFCVYYVAILMRHDRGDILAGRLDDLRWEVLIIFQPRRESGCDHSKTSQSAFNEPYLSYLSRSHGL